MRILATTIASVRVVAVAVVFLVAAIVCGGAADRNTNPCKNTVCPELA